MFCEMTDTPVGDEYINYEAMLEHSLRLCVLDIMSIIAERGVAAGYKFFITFDPQHERNILPKYLKLSYKDEMTIVIQKKYKNLFVSRDSIDVTLYFNGVPERLHIHIDSVLAFFDPQHDFALKFGDDFDEDDEEFEEFLDNLGGDNENGKNSNALSVKNLPALNSSKKDALTVRDNLIMLDRFRKK